MNESTDKQLDDLSRKVIGKSKVESPSFDFTQTVMEEIQPVQSLKGIAYVPLISSRIWSLIGIGMLSLIAYVLFAKTNVQSQWLEFLSLEYSMTFSISEMLSGFKISQTVFYAALLFAIMFAIQITFMKHQFDKRFD